MKLKPQVIKALELIDEEIYSADFKRDDVTKQDVSEAMFELLRSLL